MTAIKKEELFGKVVEILSNYEVEGISTNELIQKLETDGIVSRNTFYKYWELMKDPKKANIIELKKVKKQQMRCFPTQQNRVLDDFKNKMKIAEKMLELIENLPIEGDCFGFESKKKFPEWFDAYYEEVSCYKPQHGASIFPISYKPEKHNDYKELQIFTLQARYDFLKNFPLFLINFISHPKNNYVNKVKDKCVEIVSPLIIRSVTILQKDYPKFTSFTFQLEKLIQKKVPYSLIAVTSVKSLFEGDHESEFLKILGRYYFILSLRFSNNLNYDSSQEQKIISNFIETFFHKSDIPKTDYDKLKYLEFMDVYSELQLAKSDEHEKRQLYDKIRNSLGDKIGRSWWRGENDPYVVLKYYTDLLIRLELFSKIEKIILKARLGFAQDFAKQQIKEYRLKSI